MRHDDRTAGTGPGSGEGGTRRALLSLALLATVLGAGHHVDHLLRGNHVGWPATEAVNAFTYSLGIYPLVAVGVVLTLLGRAGARYWFGVSVVGFGMLATVHLGPWAIEPPGDIVGPYLPSPAGYLAFAWLLALLVTLLVLLGYAGLAWRRATS